jgi:hypothetical protein
MIVMVLRHRWRPRCSHEVRRPYPTLEGLQLNLEVAELVHFGNLCVKKMMRHVLSFLQLCRRAHFIRACLPDEAKSKPSSDGKVKTPQQPLADTKAVRHPGPSGLQNCNVVVSSMSGWGGQTPRLCVQTAVRAAPAEQWG